MSKQTIRNKKGPTMTDPRLMAALANARPANDPMMFFRQQEVALTQTGVALEAAKYILSNGPLFDVNVVRQAHSFVMRCMAALDNIQVQQPQPPASGTPPNNTEGSS